MQEKKQEVNEEINYEKIITQGRDLINDCGEFKKGEYFINLALLSHNIVESSKINCIAIKSFLNFKLHNEHFLCIIVKKYFSYIKEKKHRSFSSDTILSLVKGFYRGGLIFLETGKFFLSAFCLYKAKQLLVEQKQKVEKNIEDKLIQVMTSISNILNDKKDLYKKNVEFFKELQRNIEEIQESSFEIGETHYVISTLWINNLREFLKNDLSRIDKFFDKIPVTLLYPCEDNDEEYQTYLGNYPGPINNFFIMNFKECWIDPDPNHSHTNVYMRNDIKEKTDFFFINESLWRKLTSVFEGYFEIPRKVVTMFHQKMIEVHLKKFKVLVLADFLRQEDLRHQMFPKYIQISKLDKVKDLKSKMIRILTNLSKDFDPNKYEMKIFLPEYVNEQKQIFDIVYQYSNKFSNSFKIKYEELDDENLEIDNSKIVPKDILIIEFKDLSQSSFFIQPLKEEKIHCYICEDIIEQSIVNCEFCEQYFYCSVECKKQDKWHAEYHKNLNQLLKKKINLEELLKINISTLVEKHSKGGLTGLKNLGNTCFMNSALQCLSHTEELTKYFLLNKYVEEINKKNKLGTCGKMAESWHELLQNLWLGSSNYLNPSDFRSIFVKFAHQFAGYSQHDSHEMLAFMLDALHEDLNRVKDKPYIEMQECQEGEDEKESSSKWWNNHIRRENSIIVDLFHGQYKSKITCPECKRISITYDPFMYLGIPIPSGQRLKLKYFSLDDIYNYIEIVIPVNENMTIYEVKLKILDSRKSNTLNSIEKIESLMVKDRVLKREMKNDEFFINIYEHDFEVIFYEKENYGPDYITFYVLPMILNDSDRRKSINRSIMYYVRPFQFHKSQNVRDLYYKIFLFYRKVLDDIDPIRNAQMFLRNLKDDLYLKKEFELYLSKAKSLEDFHIKINILYNIPEHVNIMSGNRMTCEFCGENCEYCRLKYDFEVSLEKIYLTQTHKRPFILLCELRKKPNLSPENEIYFMDSSLNNLRKDSMSIYDCLEAFSLEEKLEQDNAWYCNKCKKHQLAMKKLEIYKAPYILIVQIKRFKIKTNYAALSSLVNRKNDCLISFPLDNLDLINYVVGPEKNKAHYDLFAISQHYGSLSGGHYTALCRNSGGWYKFDDESVYKESRENVVTNSAYLLFYKRKYI